MYDGLFPRRGSNADRALTKSLREEHRLRIVRPLEKSDVDVGTSHGGIYALPGEVSEQGAFGVKRRLQYGLVPPSQERLDAQRIGSTEIRLKELEVDVSAIREQIRQLVELMQILMSRQGANAGNLGAGP